jgi:hypothetical protein
MILQCHTALVPENNTQNANWHPVRRACGLRQQRALVFGKLPAGAAGAGDWFADTTHPSQHVGQSVLVVGRVKNQAEGGMVYLEGPDGGDIIIDRSNASRQYGSPFVEVLMPRSDPPSAHRLEGNVGVNCVACVPLCGSLHVDGAIARAQSRGCGSRWPSRRRRAACQNAVPGMGGAWQGGAGSV